MQIYKVGGCVRDFFMGVPSRDTDYVVVGSTVAEMKTLGYKQVGNDFPVFLHSVTGEEYAMARTERKTGNGYNGFDFDVDNISIESDLARRDLSINAIAMDSDSNIIDPFNGVGDIQNGILRHISPDAFKEDPVRVLRVARFLARWPRFTVHKDTTKLCQEMVESGELNHLTKERVVLELRKALSEEMPSRFFVYLAMIGALKIIFPEIDALRGIPQPFKHHPEGDAFVHTMLVLDNATNQYAHSEEMAEILRFSALCHDLGKATTPVDILPSHHGHENRGERIVKEFCDRYIIPNDMRDHAMLVAKYHTHIHNFMVLNPKTIVNMFDSLSHKKNKYILDVLPLVSFCDATGKGSFYEKVEYPNEEVARRVFRKLANFKLSNEKTPDEIKDMSVEKIKSFIFNEKIKIVKEFR